MVTDEKLRHFVELMDEGGAAYLGTRDARLRPALSFTFGVALGAAPGTLLLYLPTSTAAPAIANLRDNRQAALVICRVVDFRTYQVKGEVVALRDARPDERPLVERQHEAFARGADEDRNGSVVRAWAAWPVVVAELRVREVYLQTPGPGAGRRVS